MKTTVSKMVERIPIAFKTSDGELHETESAAKDHEFGLKFDAWWEERQMTGSSADEILDALKKDRHRLLAIFRELNGDAPAVAAPKPVIAT